MPGRKESMGGKRLPEDYDMGVDEALVPES